MTNKEILERLVEADKKSDEKFSYDEHEAYMILFYAVADLIEELEKSEKHD